MQDLQMLEVRRCNVAMAGAGPRAYRVQYVLRSA